MTLEQKLKIPKAAIQTWCNALRSGKYPQTAGSLQDKDGYCCLGVACDVFIPKEKLIFRNGGFIDGQTPIRQHHAPEWLKIVNSNFEDITDTPLSFINDYGYLNFDEIADLLEAVYIHEVLD